MQAETPGTSDRLIFILIGGGVIQSYFAAHLTKKAVPIDGGRSFPSQLINGTLSCLAARANIIAALDVNRSSSTACSGEEWCSAVVSLVHRLLKVVSTAHFRDECIVL